MSTSLELRIVLWPRMRRSEGRGLILLIAAIICWLGVSHSASAQQGEWEIECVDCPRQFESFTDHCLCIDTDGRSHVAYGRNHLYYSRHTGEAWLHEIVDDARLVGIHASMVLDAQGEPHISYFDDWNDDLKYAWRDEAGWHNATVDPGAGGYHVTCSIGVDPEGFPHICYHSYSPFFSLKYARFDGATWLVETVDPHGAVGDYNSLFIDGLGRPHISYIAGGPKYAYRDGNGWNIEDIIDIGVARYTSVWVDGGGAPHIAFGHQGIRYATRDDTSWIVETVDTEGEHVSLVVDDSNCPYVSYCVDRDIRYAYRTDSSWVVSSADSGFGYVFRSSLALDGSRSPRIAYKRRNELRIMSYDQSGWTSEKVDEEGSVGQFNSLALDESGHPHISYYDDHNKDLKYAARGPFGWDLQIVEGQGQVGAHTSVAIDPQGFPRISYTSNVVGTPWLLRYAFYDGSTWYIEPVGDQSGLHQLGRYNSLAIDEFGFSHISYPDRDYVGNDCSLRYGVRDSSGWHLQTVDDEGYTGNFTSIALDHNGRPHISYYGAGHVRYALLCDSEWRIETVDIPGDLVGENGFYTSLALDAAGNPHISLGYTWDAGAPSEGEGVRYAEKTGTDWRIEDIEEWEGLSTTTSVTFDHVGRPHIVYWQSGYGESILRLAWFDGGSWQVESITSGTVAGNPGYASLAIDTEGNRHVTYYDHLLQDLLYAFSPAPAGSPSSDQASPSTLSLRMTGPSPAFGQTSLVFGLPTSERVRLAVHDVLGRRIRLLNDDILDKGEHLMTWDGNSGRGRRVPSGTYIISVEAGGERVSKRIVMIR